PLRVLAALLERAGDIVTREHLRTRIWGESTFVEFDEGLNYCIRQIRQALGDRASKPVYLETLPKQGYRFIAPVTVVTGVAGPPDVNRFREQPTSLGRIGTAPTDATTQDARQVLPSPDRSGRQWRAAYAVVAAVAVGGAALYTSFRPPPARVK